MVTAMANIKKHNLTGQRYGRLVVLEEAEHYRQGWTAHRQWLCQCDCGNQKIVRQNNLTQGLTKSCGCLRSETARARRERLLELLQADREGCLVILPTKEAADKIRKEVGDRCPDVK